VEAQSEMVMISVVKVVEVSPAGTVMVPAGLLVVTGAEGLSVDLVGGGP